MGDAAAGTTAPARSLCLLVASAAGAAASCLGDAVPGALRRNVTDFSGQSLPLGLVELNWDSAQLALHVFKILAEERLGYHVAVTAPDYSRVSSALHVVAGCPGSDFCLAGAGASEGLPAGHLVFELWPNGEEPLARYQAEFPDLAPERLGDIGYSGREGSFVRPQIFAEALTAKGIHLSHYGSYNASWFQPSAYFDSFAALDPDRFATCADSLQNATLRAALSDYHRHFSSDPSVFEQDGALELACESDRWWLSPSCRDNSSQCVPYVDFHGWGSKMAMQQATAHNMPLAIANARSLGDWRHIVTSHRVLTFWYTPDALFADLGLLAVEMPEYNPTEFAVGLKTTAPEAVKLYNFAAPGLRSTAPDAVALVERMTIDPGNIMSMLRGLAREESISPESYYNASCKWLRQTEAVWDAWIPSKTDCIEGQGLIDLEGNFLSSRLGASGCDFCPPGSMSQRWNGTAQRVCETCSPGAFQNQPGQDTCRLCESGKFTLAYGMVGCTDCSVGTFAVGTGNVGCSPCPHAPTETTNIRGAGSRWDCLCESEYYRDAGHSESSGEYSSCLPCPAGMTCEEGNQEPRLLEGFWAEGSSSVDRAYSVYRCRDGYECPGGAAGSCADGREGIGCANCMPGHYPAEEGKCDSCGNFSSLSLVICALIGLLGLLAMAIISQVDPARVTTNHVTLGITVSHLFVTLQTLSIFSGMGVVSVEPYRAVLQWFQVMSFNLDLLQLSCFMADRDVVLKYVATLLIYPACVAVLCLVFFVMRLLRRSVLFNHAFNTVGALTMILFLVLTITGLEPFYCITSPNGHATLRSNPSVLCYQGDWVVLASFGTVAILIYGIAFLAAVIRVTLLYPYMIVSTQGGIAMNRYRFMFQRFTVESYFFTPVYLARSLFIALVPIAFADDSHRQVFALGLGLLCFGYIFASWLPWRGSLPNLVDNAVNGCIIILLLCSSLLLDVSADDVLVDMHIFLGVPLAAAMAIPLGAICYYLLRSCRSPQMYSAFLCHHKVGCAAGARLMQMDLELHLKGPVFLDSDNLENLEGLLDIVRSRVRHLVVLLTAKTLSRPWCAGEITTAFLNQVPMVPVAYDGYVDPAEADLSEDAIAADCLSLCAAQGMAPPSVRAAYVHLCALPKIQCLRLVENASTEAMRHVVACCRRGPNAESLARAASPTSSPQSLSRAGSAFSPKGRGRGPHVHLAIVVNQADPEAVSSALVLSWLFRKRVQWNVAELFTPESVEETAGPERLLVLLTEGCLTAHLFAGALVAAWSRWRASARTLTTAVNTFQYPSTQNLHSFITPQVASMQSLPEEEVATIFERLMDIIAVSFTPSGRMSVLETELRNIVSRLDGEESWSPRNPLQRRRGSFSSLEADANGGQRRDDARSAAECEERSGADEAGRVPASLPARQVRPGEAGVQGSEEPGPAEPDDEGSLPPTPTSPPLRPVAEAGPAQDQPREQSDRPAPGEHDLPLIGPHRGAGPDLHTGSGEQASC